VKLKLTAENEPEVKDNPIPHVMPLVIVFGATEEEPLHKSEAFGTAIPWGTHIMLAEVQFVPVD